MMLLCYKQKGQLGLSYLLLAQCVVHLTSRCQIYLRVGDLTDPVLIGVSLNDDLIHVLNDLQAHAAPVGFQAVQACLSATSKTWRRATCL